MFKTLDRGIKFRAYTDSVGNSCRFWVDTLNHQMNGSFLKGDVVELREFSVDDRRISLDVVRIEAEKLDVPVEDALIPVSMVGVDKDMELEPHPNIAAVITDVKNNNRVFLLLLRVPYNRKAKIRIPLPGSGNLVEYVFAGL